MRCSEAQERRAGPVAVIRSGGMSPGVHHARQTVPRIPGIAEPLHLLTIQVCGSVLFIWGYDDGHDAFFSRNLRSSTSLRLHVPGAFEHESICSFQENGSPSASRCISCLSPSSL